MSQSDTPLRALAFYLPQFHPIPENDRWWGAGFTEWTNVGKAVPLFRGHYQPHVPADLGYYDLRLPQVRAAQAEMAANYGLHGFCYYHYWFHGARLLEMPTEEILRTGEPDFPFCLCWANESWSRRWLGEERAVLMPQTYSQEDTIAHARYLARVFADPRYLRVHDRPVFIIYRPSHIPDLATHIQTFRSVIVSEGLADPWLVAADGYHRGEDLRHLGFDFTLQFHPQLGVLPSTFPDGWTVRRFARNLLQARVPHGRLKVYPDWMVRVHMSALRSRHSYSTVLVSWDNTPRRGRDGIVIRGSTPEAYAADLKRAAEQTMQLDPANRLLFINGWNEWAEGNHLEPDQRFGHAFLEATRSTLREVALTHSAQLPELVRR